LSFKYQWHGAAAGAPAASGAIPRDGAAEYNNVAGRSARARAKYRACLQKEMTEMGRIVASVTIANPTSADKKILCDALVDTGASHVVLPLAWKGRLGDLEEVRRVHFEAATQELVEGAVYGPVRI
jgi:hypothetical protein